MNTSPVNLGIKNVGQISIIVHDLPRATAFYRDTLGLALLFTAANLAFFDCGGVRLMLGPLETPELDHPSSILYFRVSDLTAAHQHLVDHCVQIVADCSYAIVRSLDECISRLGGEYHGVDERDPALEIAILLARPTGATRVMRITVSFYLHARPELFS